MTEPLAPQSGVPADDKLSWFNLSWDQLRTRQMVLGAALVGIVTASMYAQKIIDKQDAAAKAVATSDSIAHIALKISERNSVGSDASQRTYIILDTMRVQFAVMQTQIGDFEKYTEKHLESVEKGMGGLSTRLDFLRGQGYQRPIGQILRGGLDSSLAGY